MRSEDGSRAVDVAIPDEFFTDTLPRIRDIGELKILIHLFHLAAVREAPAIELQELLTSAVLRSIVTDEAPVPAPDRLKAAVDRAVANGTVLRLTLPSPDGDRILLMPSTSGNRSLAARIGEDPIAARAMGLPTGADVSLYRPNVFAFYERHIGPLTPLVAEQLRDAERSYPRAWVEAAILEAELLNKRSWRYIQAILTQWEQRGAWEDPASRLS